jgi:hypothetical protein
MEKKKQIRADHHDNVTRLKVESENIIDDYKYTRDKAEREFLNLKTSGDRVVDMKINFYNQIIDLGMSLLKLFIPIFGISFAAGVNILGMDTYTLKWISFLIIILVGLLIIVTLKSRKRIVDSEQENHKRLLDLTKKELSDSFENLKARCDKASKAIKLDLENEPNL